MPSTYSPDLRIELIPNGEQSGTWGTTTNNNLGTLIEDAISGAATISVIATNQALTAANGAADEARCAALILTTTTGAPFNIFAPPVTKLYVIYNASSYGATIYCSTVLGNTTAAGAGYDIPAGRTVFIRSNGTVFSGAITHADTLTLGTQLGVTSGGTGLNTVPALSVPVANSLNTLTALTVAANQSIRLNSAGNAWEAYTPTGGAGSVSSVGLGMPASIFTVSGSPVTTTGTLTAALNSQTANQFFAAPDGSAGTPSFRVISSSDLPNSGAVASTYGNSTNVPQITVDAKGRITSVSNVAISGGGGGVTSVTGSGAISASPTTGAVQLTLTNASSSSAGILTTGSQNIAGTKTFDTGIISGNGYNFTSNSSLYWTGIEAQIRIAANMRFFVNNSVAGFDLSDVQKVGGGTFNSYSDSRYKQDITSYTKGLAEIKQVQPKNYRYTAEFMKSEEPSQAFVGMVAQELENTAFANCVRDDANGYKVVDTSELTYALINAVKELSAKVEQLEAQLNGG